MDPDARRGAARPTPRRARDRRDPAGSERDNPSAQAASRRAAPGRASSWDSADRCASWPSGHATAAMSFALCAVLAAPARLRPLVAAVGAAFAVAVCYSFLALAWHYPSDVLGGFLVATHVDAVSGRRSARFTSAPARRCIRLKDPGVARSGSISGRGDRCGRASAAGGGGASARGCVVRTLSRAVHHRGGGDRVGRGGAGDGADARGTPLGVRTRWACIGPAPTAARRRRWPRARG